MPRTYFRVSTLSDKFGDLLESFDVFVYRRSDKHDYDLTYKTVKDCEFELEAPQKNIQSNNVNITVVLDLTISYIKFSKYI